MAEDKLFKAEYAKSGRASCKKCGESIAKDSLRLAIMVQSPMFDGKVPHWHHYSCFWKRTRVGAPEEVDGLSDLRWEDQEKIRKSVETGGGGAGGKGGEVGEKTLADFAVEYAKSNRSTCKGCSTKIEKLAFLPTHSATQLRGFSGLAADDKAALKKKLPAIKTEGKRKGDEADGETTGKKKKKKKEEKLAKQEKELKEQSQLIWGIKDNLKKSCSTNDMRELLIANGQEIPSGESAIVDRVSDGMAFGALQPCGECQGQQVLKGDAYTCTGNITAWTKCSFTTQSPQCKDWITPKEFHCIAYLKKFKFKRQGRIFPPEPPAADCRPGDADADAPSAAAGPPLSDLKVLLVGKLSKNKEELKNLVEEMGGKTITSASKAQLCISSQKEVDKMSKKMEEVKAANVRVVSEDFLLDLRSGKGLPDLLSAHAIFPWGAEVSEPPAVAAAAAAATAAKSTGNKVAKNASSKVKQRKPGYLGKFGSGKSEKKMKLTVKGGGAVDPDSGLEDTAHVLEQGGRIFSATLGLVDITRGTNSYYKLQLLEDDHRKRWAPYRDVGEAPHPHAVLGVPLLGRVGTTIGGNKLEKMSSREHAVDHFLGLYEEKTGNAWQSSNFTKYPNKFYPLEIDYGQDEEAGEEADRQLGHQVQAGQAIQDLIRAIFDVESMKKAMVEFEVVDKHTDEARIITDYVKNTHAATHNQYDLEVLEIFRVRRESEEQRFQPFSELHNRQLLWHGSRTTNFAGILSQGLRIAPPEAPVTGYMFGKGVYFADMVSKSANYCHTSQAEPVGLVLLADVALGNMYELKRASHVAKLPKGKHSVKGVGKTAPDPSATIKLDGVEVPLGKGMQTPAADSSLLYNEYIVYDVAQVNIKYLLRLNFKYKTSLW
ncbi:poly [ADP-ribose] polymerase 1 [Rhinoraja longicauda]